MPADLRAVSRVATLAGTRRTTPVAVALAVRATLAAGIGGTAEFAGARWFPHFHSSYDGVRTGTTMAPVGATEVTHGESGLPTWLLVAAVVFVAGALTVFVWRWQRGKLNLPATPQLPESSPRLTTQTLTTEPLKEAEAAAEPERLRTGIELALAALDEEREPADAVVLSRALRGGWGYIGRGGEDELRQLARGRLALEGLALDNPQHRAAIERRIGFDSYRVLVTLRDRVPKLNELRDCLDALDRLDPAHYPEPRPGASRRPGKRSASEPR